MICHPVFRWPLYEIWIEPHKLSWLLARGHDERLQSPVRLYSLRQNFCVLVCDLYWQKLLLMMDQITSSCCILDDPRFGKIKRQNPQKRQKSTFWIFHVVFVSKCERVVQLKRVAGIYEIALGSRVREEQWICNEKTLRQQKRWWVISLARVRLSLINTIRSLQ